MAIFGKKRQFLAIFFEKYVKLLAILLHSNGNFPEGQVPITVKHYLLGVLFDSMFASTFVSKFVRTFVNTFISKLLDFLEFCLFNSMYVC